MKLKLALKGRADARALRDKIPILQIQLREWQQVMVPRLANEIILDEIHERMRAAEFHPKVIFGTTLQVDFTGNRASIRVRSEYFADGGFDVALAHEEGTSWHFVEPKVLHPAAGVREGRQTDVKDPDVPRGKKGKPGGPLTFATGAYPINPESKQAPQALSWLEDGKRRFSRGHFVRGLTDLMIVSKTMQERAPVLRERYKEELTAWIQRTVGGHLAG